MWNTDLFCPIIFSLRMEKKNDYFEGNNNEQKPKYRETRVMVNLKVFPCLYLMCFKGDTFCKYSESKKLLKVFLCGVIFQSVKTIGSFGSKSLKLVNKISSRTISQCPQFYLLGITKTLCLISYHYKIWLWGPSE